MKKLTAALCAVLLVLCMFVPGAAAAGPALGATRAYCIIDADTGLVLAQQNMNEELHPASITKVMTLLLTFEAVHNGQLTMDTPVPVSEHAYHMGGSQIWLEPGEQFTLDEMIKAIRCPVPCQRPAQTARSTPPPRTKAPSFFAPFRSLPAQCLLEREYAGAFLFRISCVRTAARIFYFVFFYKRA